MRSLAICLLLALGAPMAGCLSDAALDYDRVQVTVFREDGSVAPTSPPDGCFELPVLLGSRVQTSMRVDGTFDIDFDATRDRVRLSIDAPSPVKRTFRSDDLETSGLIDTFSVQTLGGASFVVELHGICPSEPVAEGS